MIRWGYRMLVEIENNNFNRNRYGVMLHKDGQRGRPSFDISEEQLSFLLEKGFQVKDICNILGVSILYCSKANVCFWVKCDR